MKKIPLWIRVLFIIIGTLVLVAYPLALNIWLEHDSDGFFAALNGFYYFNMPMIFVLIFVAFPVTGTIYILRQWREAELNYEAGLEQRGKILINKYNELKEFQTRKIVSEALATYCKNHTIITAAQIYNYSKTPQKNNVEIKVNYVDGYVKEGTNLNGMIQNTYSVPKKLYREYHSTKVEFLDDHNNYINILSLIFKLNDCIETTNYEELNEVDAICYAYMIDLFSLLLEYYPGTEEIPIDNDKREKLEDLIHEHRYGILRGIELELFFEFSYNGSGEKEGRQYITRPITLLNNTHILLITVDPDLVNDDRRTRDEIFNELISQFEEMILDRLETSY